MVIEEKLEPSSFLAIVLINIIAMILAVPSLVAVLKPILPGVKSRAVMFYMLWKCFEVLIMPFLDLYALWQNTGFKMEGSTDHKDMEKGKVEKDLYNEEIYEADNFPIFSLISV